MTSHFSINQGPARNRRTVPDQGIEWRDYPRIAPGEYFAYCFWGKRYRDPGLHRWTCLLRWNVLSEDLHQTIGHCIPLWFPLGDGARPRASRRGKYLHAWVTANGSVPISGDRLSPHVFTRRIARVEIGDTNSPIPYSVVKRIIRWETGLQGQSVSKSTSQGRHA
jgi:hypothetical protein